MNNKSTDKFSKDINLKYRILAFCWDNPVLEKYFFKGIPAPSNLVFRKLLVEMAGAFCVGVSVGSLGSNIDFRGVMEEWNKHIVK